MAATADVRACLLGASLNLPEEWLTPTGRTRGDIPRTVVAFQEEWRLAMSLLQATSVTNSTVRGSVSTFRSRTR